MRSLLGSFMKVGSECRPSTVSSALCYADMSAAFPSVFINGLLFSCVLGFSHGDGLLGWRAFPRKRS